MPKLATPLTDIQPRNAKPKEKPYKLSDGGGLYLLVNTDGTKYWRMDYRYAGTRKTLAFGRYPETSLAQARKSARRHAGCSTKAPIPAWPDTSKSGKGRSRPATRSSPSPENGTGTRSTRGSPGRPPMSYTDWKRMCSP